MLADAGALDRIGVARAATMIYGTAALQVTLLLAARALAATARRAAAVAEAEGAVRRRRQVAERLHADRRQRYRTVRDAVAPLLAGLADGTLDPADREVRHRCAVEAGRLRRLFAETDDVADPLLHELRACSYIADQRGVVVDLQLTGRLPALDRDVRRALTEAPLLALAGAERRARVTVLGRTDEVAVSVLVDGRGPARGRAGGHGKLGGDGERPRRGGPAVGGGAMAEVTVVLVDDHPVVHDGVRAWLEQDPERRIALVAAGGRRRGRWTGPGPDRRRRAARPQPARHDGGAGGQPVRRGRPPGGRLLRARRRRDRAGGAWSAARTRSWPSRRPATTAWPRSWPRPPTAPYVAPLAAGTMAADERPDRPALSDRERTALLLWFQSMSKAAVATRMGIAETTVRQYIQRARIKYANAGRPAATRTQLLARAIQDGLIRADEVTEYASRASRTP